MPAKYVATASPYTARPRDSDASNLQHAVDDFFEFGGHDDEAFDGLSDVLKTGPYGLQQLVEAAHLLHEHGVHALSVRRRVLVKRRRYVVVCRQLVQYVGGHLVHQLPHKHTASRYDTIRYDIDLRALKS